MGRDKATIEIRQRPLIQNTYEVAKNVFDDIMIVSSFHDAFPGLDARFVRDISPVSGSLTGVVSALLWSETPYVFVLGCDMPFLTVEAIRHVVEENRGEAVTIPRTEAGFEPMHAMYHRSCIPVMLAAIDRDHMKIARLLPYFSVRIVPDDPAFLNRGISVFVNINTEEDLRRAEETIR